MTKSELKLLIREVVEEVTKMENPCWKGHKAYGTKKKNGKEEGETVSEEPSVNETMSGEEYARNIQTSKGVFKYWIEEDREPDNIKLSFYVKGPDGIVHDVVDMNTYEVHPFSDENIKKVKNWIENNKAISEAMTESIPKNFPVKLKKYKNPRQAHDVREEGLYEHDETGDSPEENKEVYYATEIKKLANELLKMHGK